MTLTLGPLTDLAWFIPASGGELIIELFFISVTAKRIT